MGGASGFGMGAMNGQQMPITGQSALNSTAQTPAQTTQSATATTSTPSSSSFQLAAPTVMNPGQPAWMEDFIKSGSGDLNAWYQKNQGYADMSLKPEAQQLTFGPYVQHHPVTGYPVGVQPGSPEAARLGLSPGALQNNPWNAQPGATPAQPGATPAQPGATPAQPGAPQGNPWDAQYGTAPDISKLSALVQQSLKGAGGASWVGNYNTPAFQAMLGTDAAGAKSALDWLRWNYGERGYNDIASQNEDRSNYMKYNAYKNEGPAMVQWSMYGR